MKTLSNTARAISNLWNVSRNSFLLMIMIVMRFPRNKFLGLPFEADNFQVHGYNYLEVQEIQQLLSKPPQPRRRISEHE